MEPFPVPVSYTHLDVYKRQDEAIAKMRSALGETILSGIDTNIDYQYEILSDPDYQAGNFDIEFLNTHRIGGISNEL